MAQDNSPAQRQARKLERKLSVRDPSPRFLIVCEGAKTEFQYLEEVRCHRHLPKANIFIHHAGVTQPRQIVDAAWDLFQNGARRLVARELDFVVAIFDRDDHTTYHDALNRALALDRQGHQNDEGRAVRFLAIPSNSCFELWLLLHFTDVQSPLHRKECLQRLRECIKDYDKGLDGLFPRTLLRLPIAMKRAHRLMTRAEPRNDGPWTGMHLLMRLLLNSPELPIGHPIDGAKPWLNEYLRELGD